MPDRITFEDKGITIELPSEPASINDLVDVIVACREASSFGASELSNNGLRTMLVTAFFLSLASDEGRFPRIQIVSGKDSDYRLASKFRSPLAFSNAREIRRIAPVAENPDFALLVAENDNGELLCYGLANVGHGGLGSMPGRPEVTPVGKPPSVNVWIEGPGHLFVSEATTCFEYRAGRARLVYSALSLVPTLRELTKEIGEALHLRSVEASEGIPDAAKLFGGQHGMGTIVDLAFRRMLRKCVELRHGGAFIVLGCRSDEPEEYDISCKYRLDKLDLGTDIADYWATHIAASHSRKDGVTAYNKHLVKCNQSKARFFNNIAAATELSAADGCVVLSRRLRVLGFGRGHSGVRGGVQEVRRWSETVTERSLQYR